ncbi:hypothetical protein J7U46_19355 [Pelomonas sp. V22]|uniref:hypothetical protein n=1 Tax=Pelomonas sp. V22 TaxID=2822139 RepID=UPI0024A92852|nr:hypothetical protein [Pelomonas sp. V22]MDI4635229.1 hypothetical protein [Pelomonas sp. V22]
MKTKYTALVGTIVAMLFASGAARAELVPIDWDGSGHFEKAMTVAPGKFAEICGKLNKGQVIAWSFKSSQPMNFNIHYHEGKTAVFPIKLDATAVAEDKLVVPVDQGYCWMWSNKTDKPVDLSLMLQR